MYNNTLSWEYWSYNSAMASLCYRKDQLHADSSCFMMYVCLQTVLIRHRVCICVCDQCSWRPDCWEPVEQMQERKKEIVACLTFGFYSSGQKHKRLYSPPTRHSFFFVCFFLFLSSSCRKFIRVNITDSFKEQWRSRSRVCVWLVIRSSSVSPPLIVCARVWTCPQAFVCTSAHIKFLRECVCAHAFFKALPHLSGCLLF